ncbi:MAG: terminase small subunit [Mesorhizobium sp.]
MMTIKQERLAPKRLRFVEEYLVDLNGTQAAIRAGYSKGTAKVTASRLLTDDNIARAISDLRSKMSAKLELTAEKVLSELAKIGFANMADYYRRDARGNLVVDVEALADPEKAAAVAQIDMQTSADGTQTIKLKLADKKGALVELVKHLGLLTEKSDVAVAHHNDEEPDPRRLAMAVIAVLRAGEEASRENPLIEWDAEAALA